MSVRVRYAPSPTGYQHIGGIRTALFNYLFARKRGGTFILRIEDTDQTRYFDGALEDIFETFKWLGITHDEGPVFQSERLPLYQEHAEKLVETGHAYYCFCTSERLEELRVEQEKNKDQLGYDRHCRNLSREEVEVLKKSNPTPVVRLKTPREGKTRFTDNILGDIEIDNSTLQDFILLKSDGFPTYHLANIVDDHLMEVSHVLRAQEWIPSTANHIILYKAFGWEPPQFYHLPMVMGENGAKLSKRHGATQVIEFRKAGYLPEAVLNFIALLGWSYNDKDELFSLDELEKIFDITKINKAPAVFNYQKLIWFNGIYIRKLTLDKLMGLLLPYYQESGLVSANPGAAELAYLGQVVTLIQERLELLKDAPEISDFMFGQYPQYKTWDKIFPKKVEPQVIIQVLQDARELLLALGEKEDEALQHEIYELSSKYGIKAGAVFMPLRIALTGIDKSPDLFPVMKILGKELVLQRIDKAIEKIKESV